MLCVFCHSIFIQPINLLLVLNRNDIYINKTISSLDRSFQIKKQELIREFDAENRFDDLTNGNDNFKKDLIATDSNYDKTIKNLINKNNKDKLIQIKFIIRNLFMSLIWSFSFFKLSKIHCGE